MTIHFNPETLEGLSYVLYIHPDTGEKGVSSWPADGQKTHRWFLQKYPNVTVLSLGIMDYNAKDNTWLPYFENGCDRIRTDEEVKAETTYVAQVLHDRYANETELKSRLGQIYDRKMSSYQKRVGKHERDTADIKSCYKKRGARDN